MGKYISIATDNELYNNRRINNTFAYNNIEHFVEEGDILSKFGIINRFHRTLRNLLNKIYDSFEYKAMD